jgi:hypothetical protein
MYIMATKTKIKNDLSKLTAEELKIYNAVMRDFPATQHESALNVAWQGGIKFQFYPT